MSDIRDPQVTCSSRDSLPPPPVWPVPQGRRDDQALESSWIFPAQSYGSSREAACSEPRFPIYKWGQPRSMEGPSGDGQAPHTWCSVS